MNPIPEIWNPAPPQIQAAVVTLGKAFIPGK
jgi:hypothetical protein